MRSTTEIRHFLINSTEHNCTPRPSRKNTDNKSEENSSSDDDDNAKSRHKSHLNIFVMSKDRK